MAELPDISLTLAEWQTFIKQRTIDRGFQDESVQDECMLLVEAVRLKEEKNNTRTWK